MKYDEVIATIKGVILGLQESGLIERSIELSGETVLIGKGAELDSLSFVALIADLEERISSKTSTCIEISLDKLDDFNINDPFISTKKLAEYIEKLTS